MSTPPGAAAPPAARRGGLGRWASTHKPEAAAGAGVVLVLVVVIVKKLRANSAAAAANNAQTTTGSTPAGQAGFYDPSGDYNSLEQQIAGLQTAMAAQTTAPASTTPAPGPSTSDNDGGGGGGGSRPVPLNARTYGGPNLLGDTWAQVQSALSGSPWHVNNKSGNVSGGRVVSFTPYSDDSINLGFG